MPEQQNPWTPETLVAELRSRGLRVIEKRNGYWSQCPCPEHDDRNPSLQITAGRNVGVIVKCHSRCSQAAVLEAIGPATGWQPHQPVILLPPGRGCLCDWHQTIAEERQPVTHNEERHWHRRACSQVDRVVLRARALQQIASSSTEIELEDPSSPPMSCFVLLGAVSHQREAWLPTPTRIGKVQKLVLDDLLELVNARLRREETRAVPYDSKTVGQRIDIAPSGVRQALRSLQKQHVIEKVSELPRLDGKRYDGMPLYALRVEVLCPVCASDVEAGPGVAGLDAEDATATGDRHLVTQPRAEQAEVPAVAVAELEDVVDAGLATAEGRAGAGGVGSVGHAAERYAEYRPPFDPTVPIPFV